MNLKFIIYSASCFALSYASASNVLVHNTTEQEDGIYALFNNQGELLPRHITGNVRLGIFAEGFSVGNAWDSGSIDALESNFLQFGQSSGLYPDNGMDGLLQSLFTSSDAAFTDKQIVLWVSDSESFLNPFGQHLIFQFDASFSSDAGSNQILRLDPGIGDLLVGEFGIYSHDYGLSGGALPGFNLEAVVPEPTTYALIVGAVLTGLVALRRRSTKAS